MAFMNILKEKSCGCNKRPCRCYFVWTAMSIPNVLVGSCCELLRRCWSPSHTNWYKLALHAAPYGKAAIRCMGEIHLVRGRGRLSFSLGPPDPFTVIAVTSISACRMYYMHGCFYWAAAETN